MAYIKKFIDKIVIQFAGMFLLQNSSKYYNPCVLNLVYYGPIYSYLNYGIILWSNSNKRNLLRLFTIQTKIIENNFKIKA